MKLELTITTIRIYNEEQQHSSIFFVWFVVGDSDLTRMRTRNQLKQTIPLALLVHEESAVDAIRSLRSATSSRTGSTNCSWVSRCRKPKSALILQWNTECYWRAVRVSCTLHGSLMTQTSTSVATLTRKMGLWEWKACRCQTTAFREI